MSTLKVNTISSVKWNVFVKITNCNSVYFSVANEEYSDSEESDESEDDETDIVEEEGNVEYKRTRIIPADHVIEHSSTLVEDPPVEERNNCKICQITLSRGSILRHNRVFHIDGKFVCKICDGPFVKEHSLDRYNEHEFRTRIRYHIR